MIVVFTEAAEADLVEIAAIIAEDSPKRAVSFLRELRQLRGPGGNAQPVSTYAAL